jgi:(2Fe-2S) ferredoxin
MKKPDKHILVCASFRAGGDALGVCHKKGSLGLLPYLQEGLGDRGLDGVMISATGCLKVCDRGPCLVVYPEGTWYGNVSNEEAIDTILDAVAEGRTAETHILQ